ncbi:cupin domain-containing protein [Novosphingobium sp. Chol11]|uniref:cupin domain-containing protein n=1 Tax=Novosphingobium sp. Chol11 TaxID=1385763 RepID=UPI0025E30095|nr:cupin domain-containing protein [Novosphingobium sp. Chol11]
MHFTDFDSAAFLRDNWQQQPLLIRNPWARWHNPLSPDELAGLACEEGIEARLIRQAGSKWAMEEGHFSEKRFSKLGKQPWTLLVQAVDHHVPEVAALIEPFRFIPNWRIDDVMVSYASDGGGVGPHFDQYDVFLVQGLGRRRWQIGPLCDAQTPLLPHDDLRLLADFEPTSEWLLEPGDILYVPPRFAHNGVAVGDDCMTYSIGFRAPSRRELLSNWCDAALDRLDDDDRFADPGLARQANPGEIMPQALEELRAMIAARLDDAEAFARWFGAFTTTPKYPETDWQLEAPVARADLVEAVAAGRTLRRNPASRYAFIRSGDGALVLFVDGEPIHCDPAAAALAERLCASACFVLDSTLIAPASSIALLEILFNQGNLAFDAD